MGATHAQVASSRIRTLNPVDRLEEFKDLTELAAADGKRKTLHQRLRSDLSVPGASLIRFARPPVWSLVRQHPPNASARIVDVTLVARDHMDV